MAQYSPYHLVHYRMAQFFLPAFVFGDGAPALIDHLVRGTTEAFLAEFWNDALSSDQFGFSARVQRSLRIGPEHFAADLGHNPEGPAIVAVLTMPEVREPLEASRICIIFRRKPKRGQPPVRYFTCEAPTEFGLPWVLGEIHEPGRRSNHGAIPRRDVVGMFEACCAVAGITGHLSVVNREAWRQANQ